MRRCFSCVFNTYKVQTVSVQLPGMFVSAHGAVCQQSADSAGAVQAARGRAAGSHEGDARQGPRPGEGETDVTFCDPKPHQA